MEDFCHDIFPLPRIRLYIREVLPEPSCNATILSSSGRVDWRCSRRNRDTAGLSPPCSRQGGSDHRQSPGDQEIAGIARSIVEQDTLLPAQGPDVVVEQRIRGRRDDCKCPVQQSAYLPVRQVPDIEGIRFTSIPERCGENEREMTVTSAAGAKNRAFRAPTSPPPMITTFFPVRSIMSGRMCI